MERGRTKVKWLGAAALASCLVAAATMPVLAEEAAAPEGLLYGGGFKLLTAQIIGVLAVGAFTVAGTIIVWKLLKATVGIRVSTEEEIEGLDLGEHGQQAYPDFVVTQPAGVHTTTGRGAVAYEPATSGLPRTVTN